MSLANRMAMASPLVSALTVEATEFMSLARQFGVQGVPRTVVDRRAAFVGALPEPQFVAAVLELAAGGEAAPDAAGPQSGLESAGG